MILAYLPPAPTFPVLQETLLDPSGLAAARTPQCDASAMGEWTLFKPRSGSRFQGFAWSPGKTLGDWSDAYGIAFDVVNRGSLPLDGRCYLDRGNPQAGENGVWTNWTIPADGRPYRVFLSLFPWGQTLPSGKGEYAGFTPIPCDYLRAFQKFGSQSYADAPVDPDTGRPSFLRQAPSSPSSVLLAIENRQDDAFMLSNVRLVHGLPPTGYQRVIDRFGQNVLHVAVRSREDQKADLEEERTRLAALPKLPATGNGSGSGAWGIVQDGDGRWAIRTPSGGTTRFLGLVGTNVSEPSVVDSKPLMAASFDGLDEIKGEFGGEFYDANKHTLDWRQLNLSRKYGDLGSREGFAAWKGAVEARLDAIGFNLVRGNTNGTFMRGSGRDYMRSAGSDDPYEGASSGKIRLVTGTVVPDPYAPGFEEWLTDALTRGIDPQDRQDSHCVGWTFGNEFNLADRSSGNGYTWGGRLAIPVTLKTLSGDTPAKAGMVAMLKKRYNGDVSALRQAWGAGDYTSFDGPEATSLLRSTEPFPAEFVGQPTQADDDNARLSPGLRAWYKDMADAQYLFVLQWGQTFAHAYRQVAPGKLVLGAQVLTQQPNEILNALSETQDVVCLNFYGWSDDPILKYVLNLKRPALITETSFSVADQGPGTMAVRPGSMVRTADDAAERLGTMLDLCAKSKSFVGLCWYQMYDQPTLTGRAGNGEANANGLYTIADRPKWPLLMRLRAFAERLRSGD